MRRKGEQFRCVSLSPDAEWLIGGQLKAGPPLIAPQTASHFFSGTNRGEVVTASPQTGDERVGLKGLFLTPIYSAQLSAHGESSSACHVQKKMKCLFLQERDLLWRHILRCPLSFSAMLKVLDCSPPPPFLNAPFSLKSGDGEVQKEHHSFPNPKSPPTSPDRAQC